jgi:hypothetical protein
MALFYYYMEDLDLVDYRANVDVFLDLEFKNDLLVKLDLLFL